MAAYEVAASSFWHMTPAEINVHIRGYEQRLKLTTERDNVNAWLIGAYVRLAVASTIDSHVEYPEKPFGIGEEATEASWQRDKMKMAGFAAAVEKKRKTSGET